MALLPGHEECWVCPQCGLTNCPDCDSEGRSCPVIHPGEKVPEGHPRRRRQPVPGRERGSNALEYGLLVTAVLTFMVVALTMGDAVGVNMDTLMERTEITAPGQTAGP